MNSIEETQPFSATALVINSEGLILTVSRRGAPNDIGLPGGKLDSDEWASEACARELREETGIVAEEIQHIFDREEETSVRPSRTFKVLKYKGSPSNQEEEITVSWQKPQALCTDKCSFKKFNEALFKTLKIM